MWLPIVNLAHWHPQILAEWHITDRDVVVPLSFYYFTISTRLSYLSDFPQTGTRSIKLAQAVLYFCFENLSSTDKTYIEQLKFWEIQELFNNLKIKSNGDHWWDKINCCDTGSQHYLATSSWLVTLSIWLVSLLNVGRLDLPRFKLPRLSGSGFNV